jgi:hypothetical protein
LQLTRRAGKDHDGRPGPPLGRRDDEPGSGADRLEDRRARGHHRLLAVRDPDGLGIQVRPARHERAQDLRDPLLERCVQDHLAALEPPHDLGGQVVGGRAQAAAGQDEVEPLPGEEAQRALDVPGPVADHRDVGDVDAALAQALGEPRPVAVLHAAREDLCARDDDPRPDAHAAQVGRERAARGCRPLRRVMS